MEVDDGERQNIIDNTYGDTGLYVTERTIREPLNIFISYN